MLTVQEYHEVIGAIRHIQYDRLTKFGEIETLLLRYTKDEQPVHKKAKSKKATLYDCVECGEEFRSTQTFEDVADALCSGCEWDEDDDAEPVVRKKKKPKTFQCCACQKTFISDKHLDDDDDDLCIECSGFISITCDSCGDVIKSKEDVHIQSDEKDEPLCKKCFDDIQPDAIDKFIEQEKKTGDEDDEDDEYGCATCGKHLTLEQCYFVAPGDAFKDVGDIPYCKGCGPDTFVKRLVSKKKLIKVKP